MRECRLGIRTEWGWQLPKTNLLDLVMSRPLGIEPDPHYALAKNPSRGLPVRRLSFGLSCEGQGVLSGEWYLQLSRDDQE
jgi:hypothetical protein